jgi:hypothetical protein
VRVVGERAFLWPQNPVLLLPDTEPQPDVTLLKGPSSRYAMRRPDSADVALLVEVADTSYRARRGGGVSRAITGGICAGATGHARRRYRAHGVSRRRCRSRRVPAAVLTVGSASKAANDRL